MVKWESSIIDLQIWDKSVLLKALYSRLNSENAANSKIRDVIRPCGRRTEVGEGHLRKILKGQRVPCQPAGGLT